MMKLSLLSSCVVISLGVSPALAQEKVAGVKADPPVGEDSIFRLGYTTTDDTEMPHIERHDLFVDRSFARHSRCRQVCHQLRHAAGDRSSASGRARSPSKELC